MPKTSRGFACVEFTDANGVECSIQKSSAAEEDLIWLGANKIGLKEFVAYRTPAWKDCPEFDEHDTLNHAYIANNSMHLNQEQVAMLIPILQRFVDTGEIAQEG